MEQWHEIRRRVFVEGVSKRQIIGETGLHLTTLNKILRHSVPPGYQRTTPIRKPKIGPYLWIIRQILQQDKDLPKKQRHTAKRIWEPLRTEYGFTGGYTIVKDAVGDLKRKGQEVFMSLVHRPGQAQVDFGHAVVKIDGILGKAAFFAMVLPHSDAAFVIAFAEKGLCAMRMPL